MLYILYKYIKIQNKYINILKVYKYTNFRDKYINIQWSLSIADTIGT